MRQLINYTPDGDNPKFITQLTIEDIVKIASEQCLDINRRSTIHKLLTDHSSEFAALVKQTQLETLGNINWTPDKDIPKAKLENPVETTIQDIIQAAKQQQGKDFTEQDIRQQLSEHGVFICEKLTEHIKTALLHIDWEMLLKTGLFRPIQKGQTWYITIRFFDNKSDLPFEQIIEAQNYEHICADTIHCSKSLLNRVTSKENILRLAHQHNLGAITNRVYARIDMLNISSGNNNMTKHFDIHLNRDKIRQVPSFSQILNP